MPESVGPVPRLTQWATLVHRRGGVQFSRRAPCDYEDEGRGSRALSIVGVGPVDAPAAERTYWFRTDPDFSRATSIVDEEGREWQIPTYSRLGRGRYIEAQAERLILDAELLGLDGAPVAPTEDAAPLQTGLSQAEFFGRVPEGLALELPHYGPFGFAVPGFYGADTDRVFLTVSAGQLDAVGWRGGEAIPREWPVACRFSGGEVAYLGLSGSTGYAPGKPLDLWLDTGLEVSADWPYGHGPGLLLFYDGAAYAPPGDA